MQRGAQGHVITIILSYLIYSKSTLYVLSSSLHALSSGDQKGRHVTLALGNHKFMHNRPQGAQQGALEGFIKR